MQHHKMFCRFSALRISCESEIFLKSETFYMSCALPYCCQAGAESCREGKAPELISPSWDQGEIPACQAKNWKVGKAKRPKLWVGQRIRKNNLPCAFARIRRFGFFSSNPSHDLTKFMSVPLHVVHVPIYVHGGAAAFFFFWAFWCWRL